MPYKIKATGRWAAQGRDVNGKRIALGTFDTKRQARDAEEAERRRRPHTTMTVTQWRRVWLESGAWKESTRQHNTERTKAFAEEHGRRKLSAVNRTIARDWVRAHPSTQHSLSAMFGAAMYEDDEHGNPLLQHNPFSRLYKQATAKRNLRADWLTADDVDHLELVAADTVAPWAGHMVRFAAETGVRPGELFVLQHDDLCNEDGRATIRRAADSKTRTVGLPKNGQQREIVLSTRAFQAAASAPANGARVFSNPRGDQFWQPGWAYYWHKIRAAAGRPRMDFYELRHYCATRLLEAGLDYPDVAVQLGHTDGGQLVRTVYGHPSHRRALDRVREALNNQEAA